MDKMATDLGTLIKDFRLRKNLSMSALARLIGSNRSYIYKLEQGGFNPSINKIEKIAAALDLSPEELDALRIYVDKQTNKKRKEVYSKETMESNVENKKVVQINVPNTLQVLYSDSAFVTSRPFGITIDFAQYMGPTQQQNVVARIGMSVDHAEAFIGVLKKKISEAKLLAKSKRSQDEKN